MRFFLKLDSCCCGCSLRTGTLILSWVTIIGSIMQMVQLLAVGGNAPTTVVQFEDPFSSNPYSSNPYSSYSYSSNRRITMSVILGCLLNLGVGICGVYAVEKKKPAYLVPSIILNIIGVVGLLISTLVIAVLAIGGTFGEVGLGPLFLACILLVALAGVSWYFVSVIHSHYMELKGENAGRTFA